MKKMKPAKSIDTRRLRALAPVDLSHAKGGGVSTSPTGPVRDPSANPCGC